MSWVSLAEIHRMVISRFRGEHVKSSDMLDAGLISTLATEAYKEIQREHHPWMESFAQDSVANQIGYNGPVDILDRMVLPDGVRMKVGASEWTTLDQRDWAYMRRMYGDFANPDATTGPRDWAWSGRSETSTRGVTGQETFDVMFPAKTAYTDGLIMDYVPDPGTLSLIYDQSTITAAVQLSSQGVTLSSDPLTFTVRADLLFGVKASAGALPSKWYRIATSPAPTQTTFQIFGNEGGPTNQSYGEATNGAALFVICDVSKLELRRPGLIGYGVVEYILWKLREMEEGAEGGEFNRRRWVTLMNEIGRRESKSQATVKPAGPTARSRYPALWRK